MLLVLRVRAFLPFAAAGLRRIERKTIARLNDAGANTAERAILLEERGGSVSNLVYRRLTTTGALVYAGNDRYYLNQRAYDTFCRRRRRRAIVVLAALAVMVMAMYSLGVFS